MPKMTLRLAFQVFISLETTESLQSISTRTGLGITAVKTAKKMLEDAGRDLSFRPTSKQDKTKMARVIELFRTTDLSSKAIAGEVGLCPDTIVVARNRFYEEERARGSIVPQCPCGQDLHHPYLCSHRHALRARKTGRTTISTLSPAERSDLRAALLDGTSVRSVSERFGVGFRNITKFVEKLSAEDRTTRSESLRVRRARSKLRFLPQSTRPKSTRPMDDPSYARIAALVGNGLDPTLRDDIISEVYLALAMGELRAVAIPLAVKKARSKAYGEAFYGHRSLDEVDQFGQTLLDRLSLVSEEVMEDEEMQWDPEGSLRD